MINCGDDRILINIYSCKYIWISFSSKLLDFVEGKRKATEILSQNSLDGIDCDHCEDVANGDWRRCSDDLIGNICFLTSSGAMDKDIDWLGLYPFLQKYLTSWLIINQLSIIN